jgi:tetratricopeptide (TPR) repeat protein
MSYSSAPTLEPPPLETVQTAAHWLDLARFYFHQRHYHSALSAAKQAIYRAPEDAEAWHLAAVILQQVNRHQPALKAYVRALELAPEDYVIRYNQAQLLETLGHRASALADYKRILQAHPTYQDVRRRVAVLKAQLWENRASVLEDYEKRLHKVRHRPVESFRPPDALRLPDFSDYAAQYDNTSPESALN